MDNPNSEEVVDTKTGEEISKDSGAVDEGVDSKASQGAGAGKDKGKDEKIAPDANPGDEEGPEADENPEEGEESEAQEWPEYEDPAMTAIVDIFKEKGVDIGVADNIFAKALESGNIEDIDVEGLKKAVGEQYSTLIMGTVSSIYTNNVAAVKAVQKMAYDALGGKAGWDTLAVWAEAKAKTDKEFNGKLDTYKSMITAGGEQAMLAIKTLKEQFMADPNTTVAPDLERGDGTGSALPDVKPIVSKVDYVNQLKEAYKKGDSNAVANIRRARAAGRKIEQSNMPTW